MEKHILVKIFFTNRQNMGLPLWGQVAKTIHGKKKHWLSGKEKVLGAAVNEEGHTESSEIWQEPLLLISREIFWLNSTSYCRILKQNSLYLMNILCVCGQSKNNGTGCAAWAMSQRGIRELYFHITWYLESIISVILAFCNNFFFFTWFCLYFPFFILFSYVQWKMNNRHQATN